MNKQDQQSGDNSTNIQATQLVINNGPTYAEVRDVALDVFRANFYNLAGEARDIARARAEEITLEFLKKLETDNPSALSHAKDPSFQQALFIVQKEYAITGDKELGNLLVDLLVDRSKHEQRSMLQIVLNESLKIAPKLTTDQLATLAITFLFKYTQNFGLGNHEKLGEYFDQNILPFVDKLSNSESSFQHLLFCSCGMIIPQGFRLEQILTITYRGLFFKGFEAAEIVQRAIAIGQDERFFVPCLNDLSKLQIKALGKGDLQRTLDLNSVSLDDRTKINILFDEAQIMSDEEVINLIVSLRPYMEDAFSRWNSSAIKNFGLTSVGMAIGHANIKRLTGEITDLSIWIN
ncbi:LPO_1073/Vpar_1526 family protein [Nitrosospira sp. Nsp1]|uniref:LPO_1073/Vpar_1526 family protein n=1 Tax=Nitrosospira sp. Nsp1 TaxID=136547 RepID=UPI00088E7D5C|nr:LPO_1073/Vpar_1526 family protein [Nitrosospira sp. Nsp1]SCX52183.1 hypothetical protein SAMN05720354_11186 [Nitrosospira sp. Nsp1]